MGGWPSQELTLGQIHRDRFRGTVVGERVGGLAGVIPFIGPVA